MGDVGAGAVLAAQQQVDLSKLPLYHANVRYFYFFSDCNSFISTSSVLGFLNILHILHISQHQEKGKLNETIVINE